MSVPSSSDKTARLDHIGVKEAVFPFARFPGVDTVLGPEMKSTGEVMGIDRNFAIAFAKSQIGGGSRLPREGTVFVSVRDADKPRVLEAIRLLVSLGFGIIATSGTQRYLAEQGVPASKINKVLEGRPHIVDAIKNGGVQLVFNTTEGATAFTSPERDGSPVAGAAGAEGASLPVTGGAPSFQKRSLPACAFRTAGVATTPMTDAAPAT